MDCGQWFSGSGSQSLRELGCRQPGPVNEARRRRLTRYRFWPVDATGYLAAGSPTLAGEDRTIGSSGACGVNKSLDIRMPFRLDKEA